ncbi:MAG: ribbon-helix-helix domain-containing protein [Thermoplasmata archaeon]|nr:ribbon-helix-helix domain-containing protein [Thermoplasmata archaeon]
MHKKGTNEDENMETDSEKVTIRIPRRYLKAIDFLVRADDFPSRSEAIRAAIRDMVYDRIEMVPDKLRKIQDAEQAVSQAEALERELIKR